jgi:hypothetical protein
MAERGDYDDYAAQCVRQAEQTNIPEQKALLLMMARAWTRMTQQSERIRVLLDRFDRAERADK